MRFILGLLIGAAIGFAAALLFAGNKRRSEQPLWSAEGGSNRGNGNTMSAVRRAVDSFQEQVNEALTEAKQASKDTEDEMRARYEKLAKKGSASKK